MPFSRRYHSQKSPHFIPRSHISEERSTSHDLYLHLRHFVFWHSPPWLHQSTPARHYPQASVLHCSQKGRSLRNKSSYWNRGWLRNNSKHRRRLFSIDVTVSHTVSVGAVAHRYEIYDGLYRRSRECRTNIGWNRQMWYCRRSPGNLQVSECWLSRLQGCYCCSQALLHGCTSKDQGKAHGECDLSEREKKIRSHGACWGVTSIPHIFRLERFFFFGRIFVVGYNKSAENEKRRQGVILASLCTWF